MLSAAATPPASPTPIEEIAAALDHIGPLHGLPIEERLWLARHGQEIVAPAGEVLFEEGAPAEHMILILKGEIHVRRQRGGPMALFIGRAGQMTGLLPFSRMKGYGGQGFAITPVWALLIHKSLFPEMLQAIPSMGQRVVSTLLDRVREVTRIEQQAEKLTALGKLAGNLAHELNNPASAAQRAASSLVAELRANRQNRFKLVNLCLSEEQMRAVEAWEEGILSRPRPLQDRQMPPPALPAKMPSAHWLGHARLRRSPGMLPRNWPSRGSRVADLDELRSRSWPTTKPASLSVLCPLPALLALRGDAGSLHGAHLRPDQRHQGLLLHGPRADS